MTSPSSFSVALPPVTQGELAVDASLSEGGLTIRLRGTADLRSRDFVDGYLPTVHDEALRSGAAEVRVDFRELEFMNSSCFKSFVTWISRLKQLEPARRYKIRFLSSPTAHWQKRSLHALSLFEPDLVAVE